MKKAMLILAVLFAFAADTQAAYVLAPRIANVAVQVALDNTAQPAAFVAVRVRAPGFAAVRVRVAAPVIVAPRFAAVGVGTAVRVRVAPGFAAVNVRVRR